MLRFTAGTCLDFQNIVSDNVNNRADSVTTVNSLSHIDIPSSKQFHNDFTLKQFSNINET